MPRTLSIFLISGCMMLMAASCSHRPDNVQTQLQVSPFGKSTPEDRDARARYEFNRLKNPATGIIPRGIRARELNFADKFKNRSGKVSSPQWFSRGPNNIGGRTRALAFDIDDENIILAGGVTGGMWRSADGGENFQKTTRPDQIHSVTSIAQDVRPGKTDTWYYGTGEYYGIVNAAGFSSQFSGNGIFKSVDGGLTWLSLTSTVSNTPTTMYENGDFDFVWELVTDHTDLVNDVVLAAVYNGIYRSEDGGASWTAVLGLDQGVSQTADYVDLMVTPGGVFYATMSSDGLTDGIFRSEDGINWNEITPLSFPSSYRRIEMAYAPSDENQLYFIAETPGAGFAGHSLYHYTYISGNGSGAGGSWDNRTANLPGENCTGFYTFNFGPYNSQNSYDICIAVKPDDPNVVFLGGTNVYRSTDGWTSGDYEWIGGYQCDTAMPSNYIYVNHHPDIHKFLFSPSNTNVLFTASDGGIHKTTNCLSSTVSWESLNNQYNTAQFYTVAIEPGETYNDIIIGGLQDNGTLMSSVANSSSPWESVFYGDGAYAAITRGRSQYYLSWQTGKVFKFDIDDDANVLGLTRIDPINGSNYLFINPFILDPVDENIMFLAAGYYIWRNDSLDAIPIIGDEYNSISIGWDRLNGSYTGNMFFFPRITTLDISDADPDKLYYGTELGSLYRIDSSKAETVSKIDITGSDFPSSAYLSCVEVDRMDASSVMATFSNYEVKSIFYSEDYGSTWMDVSGNLEENPDGSGNGPSVTWAHIYHDGDSLKFYVGTSIGLFSTKLLNGSQTEWIQEGTNSIGNVVVNMITSRVFDEQVVVATHGNGMYSSRQFPVNIAEPELKRKGLHLSQNYPNPFSAETSIEFSIEEDQQIALDVFSLQGNKVATLINHHMPAGKHKIKWDGRSQSGDRLSSGNYVYVLDNGLARTSQKLTIAN